MNVFGDNPLLHILSLDSNFHIIKKSFLKLKPAMIVFLCLFRLEMTVVNTQTSYRIKDVMMAKL